MFLYWLLFSFVFYYPRQESSKAEELAAAKREASLRYQRYREEAIRMNEMAARINCEADARAFVDAVADMFADSLPPSWVTGGIRERIAHAEYEAVSNPLRQIPEQRIADVWNRYVREVGASEEAIITSAEIHSMRDATFATGQVVWSRGMSQSAWTMPNIFAIGGDGKVAEGCRAVEALRILYDLDRSFDNLRSARERIVERTIKIIEDSKRLNRAATLYDLDRSFDNLRSARERLRKGVVASDAIKKSLENTKANQKQQRPSATARVRFVD